MWDLMSADQRLRYISNYANSSSDRIDHNLIHLAEENLRLPERERYVDMLSAEAAMLAYRGLSETQIQAPETTQRYYFYMIHISVEIKAKCLWHAVEQVGV